MIYHVSCLHINWPLLHNIGNKQANTVYPIPETHVCNLVKCTHTHTQISRNNLRQLTATIMTSMWYKSEGEVRTGNVLCDRMAMDGEGNQRLSQ